MTWRETLPVNRIELWILRIAFVVFIFLSGIGTGIFYTQFISKNNFQGGAEWMQGAYTSGGIVTRVVQK